MSLERRPRRNPNEDLTDTRGNKMFTQELGEGGNPANLRAGEGFGMADYSAGEKKGKNTEIKPADIPPAEQPVFTIKPKPGPGLFRGRGESA